MTFISSKVILFARCIAISALCVLIYACNNQSPNTSIPAAQNAGSAVSDTKPVGTADNGTPLYERDYETTTTGKRIRRSALGVTVRFPDGWKKADMDFQIDYCKQMMASVETIDSDKFCICFLEKVQYYYEPIYVRDSYEYQQHWNKECFEAAQK